MTWGWERVEPAPAPPPPRYLIGCDLAQSADYTGIAVLEQLPPVFGVDAVFRCGHLERLQGVKYTDLAVHIRRLVAALTAPRRDGVGRPVVPEVVLVYDRTGVGAGVGDLFDRAGIAATIVGVTITAGETANGNDGDGWRVPKKDLVGAVAVVMQAGRLRIQSDLTLTPILTDELGNFRSKANLATGHETFAAWRESDHDDLVLAVALAVWYGARPKSPGWTDIDPALVTAWIHS